MSWTNLSLDSLWWSNQSGYPAARVRAVAYPANDAELEGYLSYSGTSYIDTPMIVEASLPSGTYDPNNFHTIEGRCYGTAATFLGCCEILITTNGSLGIGGYMPTGTVSLFFGDVYPVA